MGKLRHGALLWWWVHGAQVLHFTDFALGQLLDRGSAHTLLLYIQSDLWNQSREVLLERGALRHEFDLPPSPWPQG